MSAPDFNTWANVPNIATLRSFGGLTLCDQAANVVNVIGYYTATIDDTPDGGGGTFVYNAADTTTADNGGTIIVDAAGRRWYRQFSGTRINVKWFGAKGDGTAAAGVGTDDTVAIQAAIHFSNRASLGLQFRVGLLLSLYFPAGFYRITDTLETCLTGIDRGLINWEGDGRDIGFYYRSILTFDHTNTVCIKVDPQFAVVENAVIKDMGFYAIHQTTLQHCFSFLSGFDFVDGMMENVRFDNFTGCAIWFPAGSTAYMQHVQFNNVLCSNVGGLIGSDPSFTAGGSLCNVARFQNCNLENSVNTSIATQPAFFNLYCFNEVQMEQTIYEGAGSTPAIIRYGGNGYFQLSGFHMEITAPAPTNFMEIMQSITGQGQLIELSGITCENGLGGKVIKFNGRSNTIVRLTDYGSAESKPQISDVCDFVGAGVGCHVEINDFPTNQVPYIANNEIFQIGFNNVRTAIGGNSFITDGVNIPYLAERGAWLDALQDGIASISFDDSALGGIANIGMFTDADEGRCFEAVSHNNTWPFIKITVTPPSSMVGQQMIFAVRFYLDSGQTPFSYAALVPNVASQASHSPLDVILNAWNTEVAYCIVPNTTPFTINSSTLDTPSGVKKLRIAGIYIAAGTEVPVTMIGGVLSTKSIEWSATAAPTYGAYIVGDKVINSVPAVGQPLGWVCTVAGSPGTWVALANL